MSRIDGTLTIGEIAEETGKPLAEVEELFERLALLNAVAFEEPKSAADRPRISHAPAARPSGSFRLGPIIETVVSGSNAHHPAASLYDPAELDEPVEIDVVRRRRILDAFYSLEKLNHYELFGVAPSADRRAIKEAYFAIVNVFHPDRYFGKNLGSFKQKLEKVFSRLTESYDALSRKAPRAAYDAYLRAQSKTRAFDSGQLDDSAHRAALAEVVSRIQAEASAESRGISLLPPPPIASPEPGPDATSPASQRDSASLPPRAPSFRPSSYRPSDPDVRRRALARKLGRSLGNSMTPPDAPPDAAAMERVALEDTQRQEWAASELKRRYTSRTHAARDRQVETYTRAASQALAKGDAVGASNALRIAVSLAPDDPSLAEQLNEVAGRASSELSASYLEQAEYEERGERYLAAAKSYTRAAQGKPEARVFERIAHCLLAGDGNIREAGEMAKRGVLLEPDNARYRVTLARFYIKAGLKQSAEGELSRAATLAPKDDTIADWIRRLKRDLG